jgi:hypothetical protein
MKKSNSTTGDAGAVNPPLISAVDAARYIGLSPVTLANWRSARHPARCIPHVKIGSKVFYRKAALDAFIAAGERGGV